MTTQIAYLTTTELTALYQSGELSPVEATRATLDRLAEVNPKINAFNVVMDDSALAAAKASEKRWRTGSPIGPLDGVPVSIKDNIPVAGFPCRNGSLTTSDTPVTEDAPPVTRLKEAGAVLFGKTTLPDYAHKGVTDSPLTGITRNPWNLDVTPGGSSGGASAALAAGVGPLAVGSDGGGSIRIPCSFTGLAGIKPTYGRVAAFQGGPFIGMSHKGPMARTVRDAGLLLNVLAAPDPRDGTSYPSATAAYDDSLDISSLKGLRIAFTADFGTDHIDPEVRALVAATADVFQGLGAEVTEAFPDLTGGPEAFGVIWNTGIAKVVEQTPADKRDLFDKPIKAMAAKGREVTGVEYLLAMHYRDSFSERLGRFHQDYDLLITPTLPCTAFEVGHEVPPDWKEKRWMTWSPFCYPFNFTQQPAASVPCGLSNGLPVGLQIVGRRHEDALVLRAAAAYENAAGGFNELSDRGSRLNLAG
ncbi:aspartyl-tRNA(Asn)/glutamyl-tRNA(Gln) amidotransferase subunit A [Antricoccus suffuscus]|uniref:Aspartyl-tRNA(Asn)/glutamyl-tRNA(Gln) amidotransferase subunit A n=1 Tax=Antricoccus suffuscus TaxID=1629062 RepID=A0A2T0ZJW4_9ACTN|nr:amidase [Antricoccus suffuscus]PRZ36619.1 aspartyl-tRNA(Asn)/glutamyl-tRNA(Gln) amidotransferase subunit A [Antricoccus suffuscus]